MKMLTNSEIMDINQNAEFDSAIGYARKIESAALETLKAQGDVGVVVDNGTRGTTTIRRNDDIGMIAYGTRLYEHPLPPADVVRDAERYRWLRDVGCYEFKPFVQSWMKTANECDAAIDAAMEKMK